MLLCVVMVYYERNLPHWHPERRAIFLTWRLYGSLPEHVLATAKKSKNSKEAGKQFARLERFLDRGSFGPLWLNNAEVAHAVESCISRGANELGHYELLAYVVMPNRAHLLVEPRLPIERIMRGIKGVSARDANRILKRPGLAFWQGESFDHWIRTAAELDKVARYIENNPVKAGLAKKPEGWPWSSAAKR